MRKLIIARILLGLWFAALCLVPVANSANSCVLESHCPGRMIERNGEWVWRLVCDNTKDWPDEDGATPDLQISSCTAVIESDKYSGNNLASAFPFYQRGLAYYAKREYDSAIADFTKAIEIHPRYDAAYNDRGNSYDSKREYDSAIADFSKAIEIDPQYTNAYRSRGYALFYKGDFKNAASDFERVSELKNDFYSIVFRYLARARAGEQAVSELEVNAERLKVKEWPFAVIELLVGKRTPETTLPVASKPEEVCKAHFYIGQWHLLRDESEAAGEFLRTAVETCPKTFIEYRASVNELKRVQLKRMKP